MESSRSTTPPGQIQRENEPRAASFTSFYNSSVAEYTSPATAQRDARLDNASEEFDYHWIGPMKMEQFVLEYLAKDLSQMRGRDEDDPNFQLLKEVMGEKYRHENEQSLNHDLCLKLSACFPKFFSFEYTGSETSASSPDIFPNITVRADTPGYTPSEEENAGDAPQAVMNIEIKNVPNHEGFAIDLLKDPSECDQPFVLGTVLHEDAMETARIKQGLRARFIMADRSAAVVSEDLPLFVTEGLQTFLKFFDALYANMAATNDRAAQLRCGYDPTVVPATQEEAKALARALEENAEAFSQWSLDTSRVVRIEGPPSRDEQSGDPNAYICFGKPVNHNPTFLSRGTHCYVGISLKTKAPVFIKDSWRFVVPNMLPEWEVYDTLAHDPVVRGIPKIESSGDLPGHFTVSLEADAEDRETRRRPAYSTTPPQPDLEVHDVPKQLEGKYVKLIKLQHYRMVFKTIARPLTSWKNSYHLVKILRDVIQAHSEAYERNLLHRDVSVSNIFIDSDDCGLLGDWDLNAPTEKGRPRRFRRTGTWQFISAMLLLHPPRLPLPGPYEHALIDDLESFFWVLLYQVIHHLTLGRWPDPIILKYATSIFDSTTHAQGQVYGGEEKHHWLAVKTPDLKPANNPPLRELISKLVAYFQVRYRQDSYIDDRWTLPEEYRSTKKVLELFDHALVDRKNEWPENDKLDMSLLDRVAKPKGEGSQRPLKRSKLSHPPSIYITGQRKISGTALTSLYDTGPKLIIHELIALSAAH